MHPADAAELPRSAPPTGHRSPGAECHRPGGRRDHGSGHRPCPRRGARLAAPSHAPMPAIPGGRSRRKKILAWVAGSGPSFCPCRDRRRPRYTGTSTPTCTR